MKRSWPLVVVALVLAFMGMVVSGKLLAKHMHVPGQAGFLDALCESESRGVSCDQVLASRWGVFPPNDEKRGIPVALLGAFYYSFFVVWLLCIGRPDYQRRKWHLVPIMVNVAGLAGSAGFILVMASQLRTWCPLCLAVHAINTLLFVAVVFLWPWKPRGVLASPGAAIPAGGAFPSTRLALVTLVLALAIVYVEYLQAGATGLTQINRQLTGYLKEVRQNEEALAAIHLNEKKVDIPIGGDDPVRHHMGPGPRLVVFSDFECTHCKEFAEAFESTYLAYFGGSLGFVFKHYPADKECNPGISRTIHPNACKAARLAESARLLGGNDAFWKAHDLLFENQAGLVGLDPRVLAGQLGLDPDEFARTVQSEAVTQRISADVALAQQIGLKGTPGVYLEGRKIASIIRNVDGLWRRLGALYARQPNHPPHDASQP